jgi:hypothetical protein
MDEERRKLLLGLLYIILKMRIDRRLKSVKKRSVWIRKIFQEREEKGTYNLMLQQLRLTDRENHFM